jgi:hypothetical protein
MVAVTVWSWLLASARELSTCRRLRCSRQTTTVRRRSSAAAPPAMMRREAGI